MGALLVGLLLACTGWSPLQTGSAAEAKLTSVLGTLPPVERARSYDEDLFPDWRFIAEARFTDPAAGTAWFDTLTLPCDQPLIETLGALDERAFASDAFALTAPHGDGSSWRFKVCEPSKPFEDTHYVVAFDGAWIVVEAFSM